MADGAVDVPVLDYGPVFSGRADLASAVPVHPYPLGMVPDETMVSPPPSPAVAMGDTTWKPSNPPQQFENIVLGQQAKIMELERKLKQATIKIDILQNEVCLRKEMKAKKTQGQKVRTQAPGRCSRRSTYTATNARHRAATGVKRSTSASFGPWSCAPPPLPTSSLIISSSLP